MFCHGFGIVGVILGYIDVEIHEVIIMPAEQLKLEFIINLNQRVDPVHISYKQYVIKTDKQYIFIISKSMLKFVVFIMLSVAVLSAIVGFVGGFSYLDNMNASQYDDLYAFVRKTYPEINGWKVLSLERQVVNGFNYRIRFQASNKTIAEAIVYETIQGVRKQYGFTLIPAEKSQQILNLLPRSQQANISQVNIQTNTEIPFPEELINDYNTTVFQSILEKVHIRYPTSDQNTLLRAYRISTAQRIRFIFQRNDKTTISITQNNIDFERCKAGNQQKVSDVYFPMNTLPVQAGKMLMGGYSDIDLSYKEDYQNVLAEIKNKFVYLKDHKMITGRSQIVAGVNYQFAFESQQQDEINIVRVFKSFKGVYKIYMVQSNAARGWTSPDLIIINQRILKEKPSLLDYSLILIENQVDCTLKLVYQLNEDYIQVRFAQSVQTNNLMFSAL